MNFLNKIIKTTVPMLVCIMLVNTAFASENAKTVNFDCNSVPPQNFNLFHPTTGQITGFYDTESDYMSTVVNFKYTSNAVQNINSYNAQEKYTGIDVKDHGNAFEAYSIVSTAPNFKADIEVNGGANYDNEAEIVILGALEANKNYVMSTTWIDHRLGVLTGQFVAMAELSNKPLYPGADYNVVSGGYKGLATLTYGKYQGLP